MMYYQLSEAPPDTEKDVALTIVSKLLKGVHILNVKAAGLTVDTFEYTITTHHEPLR